MRKATVSRLLAADAASIAASPAWLAAAVVVPFLAGPALRLSVESGWTTVAERDGWVLFAAVLAAFLGAVASAWEGTGRPMAEGEWTARLVLPIGRRRLRLALLAEAIGGALVACSSALASLALAGVRPGAADLLLVPVLAAAAGGCAQAIAIGGRGLGTLAGLGACAAVGLVVPQAREAVHPFLLPAAAAVAVLAGAAAIGRQEGASERPAAQSPPAAFRPPGTLGPRPVHGAAYLALVSVLGFALQALRPTDPLRQMLVGELGVILFPALLLATVTSQPYVEAFRGGWPGGARLLGGAVAAVCLLLLLKETALLPFLRVPVEEEKKLLDLVAGCATHGRVMTLLVLALLPAVCEDLAFRGYLLSSLSRAWGPGAAVVASAVPFALLHGSGPRMAIMFVLGVVYGTLVVRWRSIWVGVAAHVVNNSLVLVPRLWPEFLRMPWLDEAEHVPPEFLVASALVLGLLLGLPGRRGRG